MCKTASAKFDETVELHVKLGVAGLATTTSKSNQFSFWIFSTISISPT